MKVTVSEMNIYKKWVGLLLVLLAVGTLASGCGKKDDETAESSPSSLVSGFPVDNGVGRAGLLSEHFCYNISRAADGSVTFPITTSAALPHSYVGYRSFAYISGTAYVADRFFTGGTYYRRENQFNDTLGIYISSDGQYLNGRVYLKPNTVRDILHYLGKSTNENTLCINAVTLENVQLSGSSMLRGRIKLWAGNNRNEGVIKF